MAITHSTTHVQLVDFPAIHQCSILCMGFIREFVPIRIDTYHCFTLLQAYYEASTVFVTASGAFDLSFF